MISIELRINYAHNFVNFAGEKLKISFYLYKKYTHFSIQYLTRNIIFQGICEA